MFARRPLVFCAKAFEILREAGLANGGGDVTLGTIGGTQIFIVAVFTPLLQLNRVSREGCQSVFNWRRKWNKNDGKRYREGKSRCSKARRKCSLCRRNLHGMDGKFW